MAADECLIHFTCKYGSKVQAYTLDLLTSRLHSIQGVLCLGGNQEPTCFSTISPSKHKSPAAIWKHLKPVLDNLQATHPEVSVIHVASAGPHTQLCSFGGIGRCWSSLEEDCINRQHLSFNKKLPNAVPRKETQIQWGNPEELLQWYIIRYDEDLYPGIILATDKTHIPVKCMHRVGPNSFFWPACEDVLLYFLMMCLS